MLMNEKLGFLRYEDKMNENRDFGKELNDLEEKH